MFYCKHCNNTMDIAKTIDNLDLSGGGDLTESTVEMTGGDVMSDIIDKIMSKKKISASEVSNLSLPQLIKHIAYKKLKSNEKERVYNTINDLLPKDKKVKKQTNEKNSSSNSAFFICNNCGHHEAIKPKTMIYSKSMEGGKSTIVVEDQESKVYSNILPRTRQYTCPKKECVSHKDINKRIAVFYRLSGSYRMGYTCMACKSTWTV